ncbi:PEPxxWA-CTERM sorting domain-containing protein [Pseudoduganella umbonata]|uniref:PEP-CTERM sorting domain-containing protein n=1 Tax=Pseudoduganella umbonata TaxID=864828 RepID=A0A4P8HMV4_9BURK|nr:PEPxxWA-CTERM sorting domain-containing protein [Pseudoduganella umbonata]MBB3219715.1 hypothetical protein [Pseudoduganella umbonata]QCP09764.1 PEP-CTERM sorting domain-containing protein [Pseudoduganella umbonata]
MKLNRFLSSTVVAATLLWTGAANAELYTFTLSGDYSASWQLDSEAIPDDFLEEVGIAYFDVVGTYTNAVSDVADLTFYNALEGGGLSIDDYAGSQVLLVTDGDQLYGGTEESPFFTAGTYALTEYEGTGTYTLTISAVPEPATYGMVLVGMGMVGAALRRRQGK